MAERRTLTVTMRITGLPQTIRAFNKLPKDAQREVAAASLSIAGVLAVDVRISARTNGQSGLMAPTVRAVKGTLPTIVAGGNRRVGRNRVPAYKVLFGSEFGSHSLKQYRGFTSDGYWFFRTVKDNLDYVDREFNAAWDEVIRRWAV